MHASPVSAWPMLRRAPASPRGQALMSSGGDRIAARSHPVKTALSAWRIRRELPLLFGEPPLAGADGCAGCEHGKERRASGATRAQQSAPGGRGHHTTLARHAPGQTIALACAARERTDWPLKRSGPAAARRHRAGAPDITAPLREPEGRVSGADTKRSAAQRLAALCVRAGYVKAGVANLPRRGGQGSGGLDARPALLFLPSRAAPRFLKSVPVARRLSRRRRSPARALPCRPSRGTPKQRA